jgi:hypothetical protein
LASKTISKVDCETQVPTGLWVDIHIEAAKIYNLNSDLEKALGLLMKLRQVLPPIDLAQLDGFDLPFSLEALHERPLSERAQKMFSEGLAIIDEDDEDENRTVKMSAHEMSRKLSRGAQILP